jgi:hypothetical protein
MKNFELALAELIDGYRGKISQAEVLQALTAQYDRVDSDWPEARTPPEEPEDA